jgi:hypothetical protein
MTRKIGVLHHDKVCHACGLKATKDGHDPCIANLPGVKFACCGHGLREGYIWFIDGPIIYFNASEIVSSSLQKKIVFKRRQG